MNRALKTTLLPLMVLGFLLAGCGERHEARSLAQDFMEEHMPMQDYEVVRWSRLDSTFFVTPVALKAMHAEAERSKIVKHRVSYQGYTPKLVCSRPRHHLPHILLRRKAPGYRGSETELMPTNSRQHHLLS